jgi:tetratricopeptide (TPR) repeat protein
LVDHAQGSGVLYGHLAIGFYLGTNGLNCHAILVSFFPLFGLAAGSEDFQAHVAVGLGPFIVLLGQYRADQVGEPLVVDSERVLGPDHHSTLASRDNLALAYREAGRAAEAIPLFEQTPDRPGAGAGPGPPQHLAPRDNLAAAYRAAGRCAEAIPLHEQTLAVLERVLGPDHPDTLASQNNLARARHAADRAS